MHYTIHPRLQNIALLIASYIFYGWGDINFVPIMLTISLIGYTYGATFESIKDTPFARRAAFIIALILMVAPLLYYKYLNFIFDNVNSLFTTGFGLDNIILPLGISFFTFQSISYIYDVYTRRVNASKNPVDVLLYVALFPQLIAGPIVLFEQVQKELKSYRSFDIVAISDGLTRFVIGLAKKVVIANNVGLIADKLLGDQFGNNGYAVFVGVGMYSLQIFFDFSGYSDMAIGLGKMLGFSFPENFNYPYISSSIQEFWRRWHISLGAWFREYVYFPLGGSRGSKAMIIRNTLIVFLLTGIWHGAGWTFLLWGLFNGVMIVAERLIYPVLPQHFLIRVAKHIYAITAIYFGWLLFRAANITEATTWIKDMSDISTYNYDLVGRLFTLESIVIICLALLFVTPIPQYIWETCTLQFNKSEWLKTSQHLAGTISIVGLLIVSYMYLLANSYNPFIYFRF